MLLDFHLAHEVGPGLPGELDRVGGTAGYMSPEQQRSIQALRTGQPISIALDHRSDIFSLGVLLYESLVGQRPPVDEKESRAVLHAANPRMGRSLVDLLHKCLAHDREERYADAGELAEDLRRDVANLPLRGVANRSLKEALAKVAQAKASFAEYLDSQPGCIDLDRLHVRGFLCRQVTSSALGTQASRARPRRRRARERTECIELGIACDSLAARTA